MLFNKVLALVLYIHIVCKVNSEEDETIKRARQERESLISDAGRHDNKASTNKDSYSDRRDSDRRDYRRNDRDRGDRGSNGERRRDDDLGKYDRSSRRDNRSERYASGSDRQSGRYTARENYSHRDRDPIERDRYSSSRGERDRYSDRFPSEPGRRNDRLGLRLDRIDSDNVPDDDRDRSWDGAFIRDLYGRGDRRGRDDRDRDWDDRTFARDLYGLDIRRNDDYRDRRRERPPDFEPGDRRHDHFRERDLDDDFIRDIYGLDGRRNDDFRDGRRERPPERYERPPERYERPPERYEQGDRRHDNYRERDLDNGFIRDLYGLDIRRNDDFRDRGRERPPERYEQGDRRSDNYRERNLDNGFIRNLYGLDRRRDDSFNRDRYDRDDRGRAHGRGMRDDFDFDPPEDLDKDFDNIFMDDYSRHKGSRQNSSRSRWGDRAPFGRDRYNDPDPGEAELRDKEEYLRERRRRREQEQNYNRV